MKKDSVDNRALGVVVVVVVGGGGGGCVVAVNGWIDANTRFSLLTLLVSRLLLGPMLMKLFINGLTVKMVSGLGATSITTSSTSSTRRGTMLMSSPKLLGNSLWFPKSTKLLISAVSNVASSTSSMWRTSSESTLSWYFKMSV